MLAIQVHWVRRFGVQIHFSSVKLELKDSGELSRVHPKVGVNVISSVPIHRLMCMCVLQ